MPKVCQVTGRKTRSGQNVSHSVVRTKREFKANLQVKTVFDPTTGKKTRVRVSTKALKLLAKSPKKFFKKLAK